MISGTDLRADHLDVCFEGWGTVLWGNPRVLTVKRLRVSGDEPSSTWLKTGVVGQKFSPLDKHCSSVSDRVKEHVLVTVDSETGESVCVRASGHLTVCVCIVAVCARADKSPRFPIELKTESTFLFDHYQSHSLPAQGEKWNNWISILLQGWPQLHADCQGKIHNV